MWILPTSSLGEQVEKLSQSSGLSLKSRVFSSSSTDEIMSYSKTRSGVENQESGSDSDIGSEENCAGYSCRAKRSNSWRGRGYHNRRNYGNTNGRSSDASRHTDEEYSNSQDMENAGEKSEHRKWNSCRDERCSRFGHVARKCPSTAGMGPFATTSGSYDSRGEQSSNSNQRNEGTRPDG